MHDGNIFFHSTVCGLRDHFPLYVNLYVLGYEYCPCHYPPLHFYYCQIDKILTEEWVMAYTACGIMVCFSFERIHFFYYICISLLKIEDL